MEEVPYLEVELMDLRHEVRLINAMLNADREKWFGGSPQLQHDSAWGIIDRTLMRIRRLLDGGRPQRDGGLEPGLESLFAALHRAGHGGEADRLQNLDEFKHLQMMADKRIAHCKPGDLGAPSTWFPAVQSSSFRYEWLAVVVDQMSRAYLARLQPGLRSLDPTILYDDPFLDSIRTEGLPSVDWPPSEIFGPATS